MPVAIAIPIEEHFWSKADRSGGEESCWLWTAYTKKNGYGVFYIRRNIYHAHRVAWLFSYGEIPPGLCVCHHCDVRSCVNPQHLFLGTQQDNLSDMRRKGRENHLKGEQTRSAILTEQIVIDIRRRAIAGETYREISQGLNVTEGAVGCAVRGATWKHISGAIRIKQKQSESHCINGHAWTSENTYINDRRHGRRECRICDRAAGERYRKRRRQLKAELLRQKTG